MSKTVFKRHTFTYACHGEMCLSMGRRFSEKELHFCQLCGDIKYCAECYHENLHRLTEDGNAYCDACFIDIVSRLSSTGDFVCEAEWIDVYH